MKDVGIIEEVEEIEDVGPREVLGVVGPIDGMEEKEEDGLCENLVVGLIDGMEEKEEVGLREDVGLCENLVVGLGGIEEKEEGGASLEVVAKFMRKDEKM